MRFWASVLLLVLSLPAGLLLSVTVPVGLSAYVFLAAAVCFGFGWVLAW